MTNLDWKEAAEKYASGKAYLGQRMTCEIVRSWSKTDFEAGAEHGHEVGHIEADTQWSEQVLELEAANIKLKQQVEAYRGAIKDKDLAYSLMKEACEEFKQELADMKWEYENACKFATDFEQQRDKLKQRLKDAEKALNWMRNNRALTIFIEEPAHVANFFEKADAYFAKHAGGEK